MVLGLKGAGGQLKMGHELWEGAVVVKISNSAGDVWGLSREAHGLPAARFVADASRLSRGPREVPASRSACAERGISEGATVVPVSHLVGDALGLSGGAHVVPTFRSADEGRRTS